MKKLLCLALAVAMMMSLGTTAFAATVVNVYDSDIVLSYFEKYDPDTDEILDTTEAGNHPEYGKKYYAIIFEGINESSIDTSSIYNCTNGIIYSPISDFNRIEKLKMKTEFEEGEHLVKSINIVKKKLDTDGADLTTLPGLLGVEDVSAFTASGMSDPWSSTGSSEVISVGGNTATYHYYTRDIENVNPGWYYFVEIETETINTVGEGDVIGTFTFNRKANSKMGIGKVDDVEREFTLNVWYERNYVEEKTEYEVSDSVQLEWDDLYVLKFNSDDEIEMEFGYENEGVFTVDASGQGKMVINFDTNPCEEIADANPGIKMHFVNFNGAKFNRVGEFEYELEGMAAAYQVVDHKLVPINGLEIDSDVATFNTRTLGNYVFATAELVNPA